MSSISSNDLRTIAEHLQQSDEPRGPRLAEDDLQKVVGALENSDYKWRTVSGVAQETKLSESQVLKALDAMKGWVIRSAVPAPDGSDLYTTRQHFRAANSIIARLRGIVANRGS